ncbi:hypothetical protein [Pengzhenrongella sp.]|uniref:hypothetical protein n=1 Tax=Pengzhenrongella sp. TaxID=2888820 RepID=UPI002F924371
MSLTSIAGSGGKALGDRFNLVNVVPPAVFGAFVIGLVRSGAYTGSFQPRLAIPNLKEITTGGAVLFAFAVLLIGVVLAPFQVAVVRLLEGYWGSGRLARRLSDIGVELQRRRLAAADDAMRIAGAELLSLNADQSASLSEQFERRKRSVRIVANAERANRTAGHMPLAERLLPTSLGNNLRASEDSAGQQYGLTTNVVYPRLRNFLSPRLDGALGNMLTQLDTASALCVSFLMSAVASTPLLAYGWWALTPLLCLLLAALAYQGAQTAASFHGDLLATAFDLHRFDLMTGLHLDLPTDPAREKEDNIKLSSFLALRRTQNSGNAFPFDYSHAPTAQDPVLAIPVEEHVAPDQAQGTPDGPGAVAHDGDLGEA